MTYSAESFIAVDLFLPDGATLVKPLSSTVDLLVKLQNSDGSWGVLNSGEGQRSPRALTLLQWFVENLKLA